MTNNLVHANDTALVKMLAEGKEIGASCCKMMKSTPLEVNCGLKMVQIAQMSACTDATFSIFYLKLTHSSQFFLLAWVG